MVKNGEIRHIYFDIGGVLLNINHQAAFQFWSECTALPMEIIQSHFPREVHDQFERGLITDQQFFEAVKNALPQPNTLQEKDLWLGWNKLIAGETQTVQLIPKLKKNYKVYLLSNTNPRHIRHEINQCFTFQKNVDAAFYSYDLGFLKPEPEIYQQALSKAGAMAEESLFIDDMQINTAAAEKLGMKTIHYTDHQLLLDALGNMNID